MDENGSVQDELPLIFFQVIFTFHVGKSHHFLVQVNFLIHQKPLLDPTLTPPAKIKMLLLVHPPEWFVGKSLSHSFPIVLSPPAAPTTEPSQVLEKQLIGRTTAGTHRIQPAELVVNRWTKTDSMKHQGCMM